MKSKKEILAMNKSNEIYNQDRTLNIILAILLIISVIGWVIDESNDNIRENQYKGLIAEYQSRYVTMAKGGTELFRMLKECREEVNNDN